MLESTIEFIGVRMQIVMPVIIIFLFVKFYLVISKTFSQRENQMGRITGKEIILFIALFICILICFIDCSL